jgi:hypothetical protein
VLGRLYFYFPQEYAPFNPEYARHEYIGKKWNRKLLKKLRVTTSVTKGFIAVTKNFTNEKHIKEIFK